MGPTPVYAGGPGLASLVAFMPEGESLAAPAVSDRRRPRGLLLSALGVEPAGGESQFPQALAPLKVATSSFRPGPMVELNDTFVI